VNFPQIISGGETGAQRAAHDFAVVNGLECGGWCVNGRSSECAEKNVLHSDATVVFTFSARLGKPAKLTVKLARKHHKPWLHIHQKTKIPGLMLVSLIANNRVKRLNVAGSTASEEPNIGKFVHQVLDQACGLLLDREDEN
jgi:Circularly permutated YpsA SLOG family